MMGVTLGIYSITSWLRWDRACVLPAQKAARVAELSAEGRKVLMVGDGLNGTATLAAARVASDIVHLRQDIAPIDRRVPEHDPEATRTAC